MTTDARSSTRRPGNVDGRAGRTSGAAPKQDGHQARVRELLVARRVEGAAQRRPVSGPDRTARERVLAARLALGQRGTARGTAGAR